VRRGLVVLCWALEEEMVRMGLVVGWGEELTGVGGGLVCVLGISCRLGGIGWRGGMTWLVGLWAGWM